MRARTAWGLLQRQWLASVTRARWYERARRTIRQFSDDRVPSVAAGVTFFALLAMFPAIASIVSLYGLFANPASIAQIIHALEPYVPGGAITVLNGELHHLATQPAEKLDLAFVGGLLVAIWSASGGVRALIEGLNVAYETRERRGFVEFTVTALLFTIASIALATAIVALAVVVPSLFERLHFFGAADFFFGWLRLPVSYVISVLILDIVYRLGPDRRNEPFEFLSWGSGLGAALWIVATALFAWYVRSFGSYDRVYGNLGAAVGFLTWIWIMLVILLAGAELNSEIRREKRAVRNESR
jgi:membrane protein